MTTVVYHNNVIAIDSLLSAGGVVTDNDCNKIIKKDGLVFAMCGAWSDLDDLINAFNGDNFNKEADISAIVNNKNKIYVCGIDKEQFWKVEITGKCYAIGSGADHAWTALDLGCNAVDAVKMAAKRDLYTGGRIRSHKVRGG